MKELQSPSRDGQGPSRDGQGPSRDRQGPGRDGHRCEFCGALFDPNHPRRRFGSQLCAESAGLRRRQGRAGHLRDTYIHDCAFHCPCGHREARSAYAFRAHLRACQGISYHYGQPYRPASEEVPATRARLAQARNGNGHLLLPIHAFDDRKIVIDYDGRDLPVPHLNGHAPTPGDDLARGLLVSDTPRIDEQGRKWYMLL